MIDTHTHIVAKDTARYPLKPRSLSGEWYLEAPHSAEELLGCMDAAGVEQAVLVQAVGAYTYENDYAADAANAHPGRFASACCIDPLAADACELLATWTRDRGMHGVRLFAVGQGGFRIDDPATFPVWQAAQEMGLAVIVTTLADQLPALAGVLERFPDVRVSLDHCGFADPADPDPLMRLSELANLYCKVSSIVLDRAGSEPQRFVERLVARFGADRVMWGSDFSQTHDRPYAELVALAKRAFEGLGEAERLQCFVETPRTVWPSLGGSR